MLAFLCFGIKGKGAGAIISTVSKRWVQCNAKDTFSVGRALYGNAIAIGNFFLNFFNQVGHLHVHYLLS